MNSIQLVEICNKWMMRFINLVFLNFLWIIFTLMGLGIFGIGPSTIALHCVLRQWFQGKEDLPVFKTFVGYFKENFKEGLITGVVYVLVGYILVIDLMVVESWMIRVPVFIGLFLYLASLLYLPGLVSHYEGLSIPKRIKMSLITSMTYLQYTLVLMVLIGVIYIVTISLYPGILTFIGMSGVSVLNVWMNKHVFARMDATFEVAELEKLEEEI